MGEACSCPVLPEAWWIKFLLRFCIRNCCLLTSILYSSSTSSSLAFFFFSNKADICGSVSHSCTTLFDPIDYSMPGFPVPHYLLEFAQTHVHWEDDAIQPSQYLSPPFSPALNVFQHQGLFQWVRWPKYWNFSFSISPFNEYSGLIPFRMDWFIWPQKNQMFDLKLCPHTNCALPLSGAMKSAEQVHPLHATWSSWCSSEVDGWESLP